MTDLVHADGVEQKPNAIYLKDYQAPDYVVNEVHMEFDLSASQTIVKSQLMMTRDPHASAASPLKLDGQHLSLISVAIDNAVLPESQYELTNEQLVIHSVPETFILTTEVEIAPDKNTALEGLYASSSMLCTQCEAEGFRRITFYPDRPDVMSRFTVKLVADRQTYPVLLCNGNLIDSGELDDGKHFATWQDPSLKPSYLFALVAGDLEFIEDNYTTMSGRDVVLRLYTEKENIHKCAHAMQSLKQSMKWDEDTYGREYDLDIYMVVAVNDFNMGAMENKGLNIFNASCVLASPQTATDDDHYNIQSIIGHEYFHNWSGNRVTCRDWFQLSLKEGFTVFRDQEFSSDLNSRGVKRIDDVNVLRTFQFAEDSGPMAHPVRPDHFIEISNFYTVTVYNKGAEVVRMLNNLVGRNGFRKGTDLYFSRHDGQAVTCDDFVKAIEDANQIDLQQFKYWYSQAGTPELYINDHYDAENQLYQLTIKQHTNATPEQPHKQAFLIPVAVGLLDKNGNDITCTVDGNEDTTHVLNLIDYEQTFNFENVKHKPIPSVLRGFSAPVKIKMERHKDELALLLANDSDSFNRWDAGQTLALQEIMAQITAYQHNDELPEPVALTQALSDAMQDQQIDKSLLSLILTLPSESYLADQCDVVDVDAIYNARLFTRRYIANQLTDQFEDLYKQNDSDASYAFNFKEMSRRALKNTCLAYLAETEKDKYFKLVKDQIHHADNMTEVQAALSILSNFDVTGRKKALDDFYKKWKDDAQVVEKWLGLQSRSRLPDTLNTVKQLMQHESFSMTNPNKVRALISGFCRGNPALFHAADGSGYQFLADNVIELNKLNPQIAARLVQAMVRWNRYDESRQHLMKTELQRILDTDDLSKDVYEVVSKSLS